jgi:hypothetical protein
VELVRPIGARRARLQVRRARKRPDGARLTHAIRNARRCGHDLGTRSACRVLQTERLARFTLKIRLAARGALGGVARVRVPPWLALDAALWGVQVAVGLVLPGRARDLGVAERLAGVELVLGDWACCAPQSAANDRELTDFTICTTAV